MNGAKARRFFKKMSKFPMQVSKASVDLASDKRWELWKDLCSCTTDKDPNVEVANQRKLVWSSFQKVVQLINLSSTTAEQQKEFKKVLYEFTKAAKDGWHITSRKDLFSSLDAAPAGKKVTCANNASYPIKGVGTLENGLFVLVRYEKHIQACIAETKTQAMQDAELWHARFGHVGYGSLMTLQRHNMVHDLSLLEMPPRHVCEGCVLGKMHRFAFSQDGSVRATRKLQLVHSDVCGPMRTPSVGNSLYFVTFIDDFSRFCWVYPLKAKSDVFAVFQHYVSMVENETGCKVQTLRTDRGGEYMSGAFKDFLGKKGIKHQCTMPYTPQQNGVAERKNRSLMEMARCMLKAKSFPHKLWMEAVACAAHVLNRCPTRALKTITPYESWYDRKPSVSYLRVFGCLAYAHIPQQLRGKLDDKAVKCIFVGYSSGSKGYRLYNPATNKIFESRDVIFAKTTAQPMVAFDVPHMQTQDIFEGFLPSFVENQESQQVDNFDQSFDQHVTPHDVEEIVREKQEVLREERTLPKWVQNTLQDSKLDAPLPRKTHVFIDDIPGELPPKRGDDDHAIELIPGSSPPDKPPYRVSQAQQEEIMRQVDELVEKEMEAMTDNEEALGDQEPVTTSKKQAAKYLKLKLPEFKGKKGSDPKVHIQAFESWASLRKLPRMEWRLWFPQMLRGVAQTWYFNYPLEQLVTYKAVH
ncbi:hypothetical protein L7F22_035416 [Adiantum nelumboides]|nr:hypothetical protein [Adiantum nelumboides]